MIKFEPIETKPRTVSLNEMLAKPGVYSPEGYPDRYVIVDCTSTVLYRCHKGTLSNFFPINWSENRFIPRPNLKLDLVPVEPEPVKPKEYTWDEMKKEDGVYRTLSDGETDRLARFYVRDYYVALVRPNGYICTEGLESWHEHTFIKTIERIIIEP